MKTIAEYTILAILLVLLFFRGIQPAWNEVHSDFANYFVSAKLVTEGHSLDSLYDNAWFQQQIKDHEITTPGKFSPFPPLTAWIMLPLTVASPIMAMRIWIVVNLIFLGICVIAIRQLTTWSWIHCGLSMMITGQGLFNNFAFGQVYILITAGWLTVLWLARNKQQQLAGWLLGLISWLKYFPASILVGFIVLRNKKLILATVASMVALLLIQFWFFGTDVMNDFIRSAFLPHLNGDLSGQNMYSFFFQSWDGLLRNLFVYSAENNPDPVISWASGRSIGKVIIYLSVSTSLILGMKKVNLSKFSEQTTTPVLLALPLFASFVILPATATYHFVMLVVPMILVLRSDFFSRFEKTGMAVIYSLIGFIPYGLCFSLAAKVGLVFAYPRLWLISLLYVVILMAILRETRSHNAIVKM